MKKGNNVADNTDKKVKEILSASDDKELERMLVLSKYRYGFSLNEKKYYIASEKKCVKKVFRKICIIFWVWFFFVIFSGWLLCYFAKPPNFFLDFYSNYKGYIKGYDLFCMSMMLAVLTFPLTFWLSFCEWFKIAKSFPFGIKTTLMKIALMMMSFVMLHASTGLNGLGPIGRGGGRGDIRTLAALLFDWQGSVWLNLFLFSFFAFAVATSLKPKEN